MRLRQLRSSAPGAVAIRSRVCSGDTRGPDASVGPHTKNACFQHDELIGFIEGTDADRSHGQSVTARMTAVCRWMHLKNNTSPHCACSKTSSKPARKVSFFLGGADGDGGGADGDGGGADGDGGGAAAIFLGRAVKTLDCVKLNERRVMFMIASASPTSVNSISMTRRSYGARVAISTCICVPREAPCPSGRSTSSPTSARGHGRGRRSCRPKRPRAARRDGRRRHSPTMRTARTSLTQDHTGPPCGSRRSRRRCLVPRPRCLCSVPAGRAAPFCRGSPAPFFLCRCFVVLLLLAEPPASTHA